jgi:hypothetical protein
MNDKLRLCPLCRQDVCDHDERVLANALRRVWTGVSNIDMVLPHYWISSSRALLRCALIEMKRDRERLGRGQAMALLDFTGRMESVSGYSIEQRVFVIWNTADGWEVWTFQPQDQPEGSLGELRSNGTPEGAATAVRNWVRDGALHWKEATKRKAA